MAMRLALRVGGAHPLELGIACTLLHHHEPVLLILLQLLCHGLLETGFPTIGLESQVVVVDRNSRDELGTTLSFLSLDTRAICCLQQSCAESERLEHDVR